MILEMHSRNSLINIFTIQCTMSMVIDLASWAAPRDKSLFIFPKIFSDLLFIFLICLTVVQAFRPTKFVNSIATCTIYF